MTPLIISISEEVIAEYLNAALEDENPDVFLRAIADVAKARGMSRLAADSADSEARAFSKHSHPEPNLGTTLF